MLEIKNLSKSFQELMVIDNLSLTVHEKEIVAIIGPSGCGKSTMLNIISGLLKDYQGMVKNDIEKIGYVFQEDRTLPWLSVYDNIRIVKPEEDRETIEKLIKKVGLSGFENYYPPCLSGGMRQRCAIARALYYGSQLLLMDEPFKSLDYGLRKEMLQLLGDIWRTEENAIIFVTHDIDEAIAIGERILVLSNRPTRVIKELSINQNPGNRNYDEEEILKMKCDIISLIA